MSDKFEGRSPIAAPERKKTEDPDDLGDLGLGDVDTLIASAEHVAREAVVQAQVTAREQTAQKKKKSEEEINTWEQIDEGAESLGGNIDAADLASVVRCVLDQIEKEKQIDLPPELFVKADRIEDIEDAIGQIENALARIKGFSVSTQELTAKVDELEGRIVTLKKQQNSILDGLKRTIKEHLKEVLDVRRDELKLVDAEFRTAERNPLFTRLDVREDSAERRIEQAQRQIRELLMQKAVAERGDKLATFVDKFAKEVKDTEEDFALAMKEYEQYNKQQRIKSMIATVDGKQEYEIKDFSRWDIERVGENIGKKKKMLEQLRVHQKREALAVRTNEETLEELFAGEYSAEEWRETALEISRYMDYAKENGRYKNENNGLKIPTGTLSGRILRGYLSCAVPQPEFSSSYEFQGMNGSTISSFPVEQQFAGLEPIKFSSTSYFDAVYISSTLERIASGRENSKLEESGLNLESLYNRQRAYVRADLALQGKKVEEMPRSDYPMYFKPDGWEELPNGAVVAPGSEKLRVRKQFDDTLDRLAKVEVAEVDEFFFGDQEQDPALKLLTREQALRALRVGRTTARGLLKERRKHEEQLTRMVSETTGLRETTGQQKGSLDQLARQMEEMKRKLAEAEEGSKMLGAEKGSLEERVRAVLAENENLQRALAQWELSYGEVTKVSAEKDKVIREKTGEADRATVLLSKVKAKLSGSSWGSRGDAVKDVLYMLKDVE